MTVTKRGLRAQLTNSLAPREKRAMFKDLTAACEGIEDAIDARDKKIGEFFQRGMPLSGLMASTGLGYDTLHRILRAQGIDSDFRKGAGADPE